MLFLLICPAVLLARAQWTAKDSLNLQRILSGDEELKLNLDAVKQIDFGKAIGVPMQPKEKNWLLPDESLPSAFADKKKIVLTLQPYTANTRFDWDPIYQKKIKVGKDTWRGDPLYAMKTPMTQRKYGYSNWAKNPMDGGAGYRSSLEEIRASGIKHSIMGERVNNMMVNRMQMDASTGIALGGSGVTMSGGTIGGLNLMRIFEKSFWDKKGNERRARTLEVLKAYGDSTSVLFPDAIPSPAIR